MQRLVIAEVLKPQGIRGEIKVKTFTDYPEDVKEFGVVYIDGKEYKILSLAKCYKPFSSGWQARFVHLQENMGQVPNFE